MLRTQVTVEQVAKENEQRETFVCNPFKKYRKELVKHKKNEGLVIVKMAGEEVPPKKKKSRTIQIGQVPVEMHEPVKQIQQEMDFN